MIVACIFLVSCSMISTKISSQCEDDGQIVCDNETAYVCKLLPTGFYASRSKTNDTVCQSQELISEEKEKISVKTPVESKTPVSTTPPATAPVETEQTPTCTAAEYQSCLAKKDIELTPYILRNEWQKDQGYTGGEGMEMVWDIDWNAANPNILYLTVDIMKIWKSTDGGDSWTRLAPNIPLQGAVNVVSDPKNSNIVFAAFSANVAATNYYTDDDGVYKSTDGGVTWENVASPYHFTRTKHGKIIYFDTTTFDGTKTTTIYVGTPTGLIVSTDGGATWATAGLDSKEVYDIEQGPSNTLYVATDSGLFSYARESKTATQIGTTLPSYPKDVAVHSTDRTILYAGVAGGVYKSTDSGKTFTAKTNGMRTTQYTSSTALEYYIVAISPQDPTQMYAYPHMMGGYVPYYSSDGGESWKAITTYTEQTLVAGAYYAEPITFNPTDSTEAITERSGIIYKLNNGVASYAGNGFHGAVLLDIDFIDEDTLLFCVQDFGLFKTEDKGDTFSSLNLLRQDGENSCSAVDSYNDIIVASSGAWYNKDIVRSTDFGQTWTTVQDGTASFEFIKFNPTSPNIVYADGFVSTDYGQTWQTISDNYKIMGIDAKDNSIVYGIADLGESLRAGMSSDNGKTWQQLGSDIPTAKGYDLAVDPFSDTPHLLLAVGFYGIYEYKDGVWTLRGGGRDLTNYGLFWTTANYYFVEYDPIIKDVAWTGQYGYGRSGEGIFVSFDGGTNWENVIIENSKYPEAINAEISPLDGKVYLTVPGIVTASLPELCGCSVN